MVKPTCRSMPKRVGACLEAETYALSVGDEGSPAIPPYQQCEVVVLRQTSGCSIAVDPGSDACSRPNWGRADPMQFFRRRARGALVGQRTEYVAQIRDTIGAVERLDPNHGPGEVMADLLGADRQWKAG